MKMKMNQSDILGEKYYEIDHSSGLKILVSPKPEYKSCYAIFGTYYGSVDTTFKRSADTEYTTVPEGIAHFLEHKLFENEQGDAFSRYAKTGASANAYTSFDRTCYLFSCTDRFKESLEILLDFVTAPYFTPETVTKEQGIIGQEIKMYEDSPDWRVMFNMLGAMYHNHPVALDIAGTVDSIAQIDAGLLYRCYNVFYNLSNMVLVVCGNVTPDDVLAVADKILKPAGPVAIDRAVISEPDTVRQPLVQQSLSVSVPLFMLGFKQKMQTESVSVADEMETAILLDLIAGKTSKLYRTLLDDGLINDSFGTEYFEGRGFAAMVFAGESKDPRAVENAIVAEIESLRRHGVSEPDFERIRNKVYGNVIMGFNSIESIASGLLQGHFTGRGVYESTEKIAAATLESITKRLNGQFDLSCRSLSVINPM